MPKRLLLLFVCLKWPFGKAYICRELVPKNCLIIALAAVSQNTKHGCNTAIQEEKDICINHRRNSNHRKKLNFLKTGVICTSAIYTKAKIFSAI